MSSGELGNLRWISESLSRLEQTFTRTNDLLADLLHDQRDLTEENPLPRIATALEAIAASLEKLANPAVEALEAPPDVAWMETEHFTIIKKEQS